MEKRLVTFTKTLKKKEEQQKPKKKKRNGQEHETFLL